MRNRFFVYCPRCGSVMKYIDRKFVCTVCGYVMEERIGRLVPA